MEFSKSQIKHFGDLIDNYYQDRDKDKLDDILIYYLDMGAEAFDLKMLKEGIEESTYEDFVSIFEEWVDFSRKLRNEEDDFDNYNNDDSYEDEEDEENDF